MGEPHEKFWIICFFQPHSRKSVHPRYQCDQNCLEYVSFPEPPLLYNFCSIFLFLEHLLKQNLWFLVKKSQRCGNRRSCIDDVLCSGWNFTNTPKNSRRFPSLKQKIQHVSKDHLRNWITSLHWY